jgi:hypothetical protein
MDTPKPKHPGGRPPFPPGEAALGHIHLRTTLARKSAYVRAAKPGKLTAWVFSVLDKAAGYTPGQGDEEQR